MVLKRTKTCTTCKRNLRTIEFYTKGARLDSSCKSCHKDKKRHLRKKHRKARGKRQIAVSNLVLQETVADKVDTSLAEIESLLGDLIVGVALNSKAYRGSC